MLHLRVRNVRDLERVEPEHRLWIGAEGGMEVAVLDVTFAVAPEADGVEVLQVGHLLCFLERLGQLLVGGVHACLLEEIGGGGGCFG